MYTGHHVKKGPRANAWCHVNSSQLFTAGLSLACKNKELTRIIDKIQCVGCCSSFRSHLSLFFSLAKQSDNKAHGPLYAGPSSTCAHLRRGEHRQLVCTGKARERRVRRTSACNPGIEHEREHTLHVLCPSVGSMKEILKLNEESDPSPSPVLQVPAPSSVLPVPPMF